MSHSVKVTSTLCTGCEECIEVCKKNILYINDFTGLCQVSNPTICDGDCACVKVCKTKAIKIT